MFQNIKHLDKPIIDGHVRKEFSIVQDSLYQYSGIILESEWNHIREIKLQVDSLVQKIQQKKKDFSRLSR